jgi:hypothetical protein
VSYSKQRAAHSAHVEDIVRTLTFACTFALCLFFAVDSDAQHSNSTPNSFPPQTTSSIDSADEARDQQARDLAKKANLERQAALKKDTDRLLKLAVELKGYVDKSNENVLSLDVMKKADEIEKLAHSVKDKMKGPN